MHAWSVPAFGVQLYAMPGRINETWIRLERAGIFYGQCNQICGINHAFMPIKVEAVSQGRDSSNGSTRRKQKFAKRLRRRRPSPPSPPPQSQPRSRTSLGNEAMKSHAHRTRRSHEHARPSAGLLAALALSTNHKDIGTLYLIFAIIAGRDRRRPVGHDARRADGAGHAVLLGADGHQRPDLERADHRARPDHGVLRGHAGDDRRASATGSCR